jgi:hypothetical protein
MNSGTKQSPKNKLKCDVNIYMHCNLLPHQPQADTKMTGPKNFIPYNGKMKQGKGCDLKKVCNIFNWLSVVVKKQLCNAVLSMNHYYDYN